MCETGDRLHAFSFMVLCPFSVYWEAVIWSTEADAPPAYQINMQLHDLPLDLIPKDIVENALAYVRRGRWQTTGATVWVTACCFLCEGSWLHNEYNGGLWRRDHHVVREHKLHRRRGQARLQQSWHLPGFCYSEKHAGPWQGDTLPPHLLWVTNRCSQNRNNVSKIIFLCVNIRWALLILW